MLLFTTIKGGAHNTYFMSATLYQGTGLTSANNSAPRALLHRSNRPIVSLTYVWHYKNGVETVREINVLSISLPGCH